MSVCVNVIMPTGGSEGHINARIKSLLSQSIDVNISSVVNADSQDLTLFALKSMRARHPERIALYEANEQCASYLGVIMYLLQFAPGDYHILAGQRDFWEKDTALKLLEAMQKSEAQDPSAPVMVYGDCSLYGENMKSSAESFFDYTGISEKHSGFSRALLRCPAPRGFIMINGALRERALLWNTKNSTSPPEQIFAMIASGMGKLINIKENLGKLTVSDPIFPDEPTVHKPIYSEKNLLVLSEQAEIFLKTYRSYLSEKNIMILEEFGSIFELSRAKRISLLLKRGILPDTFGDSLKMLRII